MRIVKEGAEEVQTVALNTKKGKLRCGYFKGDTIEITDAEMDEIFGYFIANEVVRAGYVGVDGNTLRFETRDGKSFSQYLHERIKAKEAYSV